MPRTAKRARPATDSADVVFDVTPWADEFAKWRAQQDHRSAQELRSSAKTALDECHPRQEGEDPPENVHTLEKTKGCAILVSGATVMCSSAVAAEEIQ